MNIHFIAIGGSAMHNLAIALHKKGFKVKGSDDEILEPSKSRLAKYDLLPEKIGWFPEKLNATIDAVILGMHARADNPELLRAQELGLKVFSYPEYIYEQTKDKKRIVIGGSHGKTTITSMILHVLNFHKIDCDYMVGAQLEGFETMVKLSQEAKIAVIEGDEYLSSPIDRRPKFHLYFPDIALISGIAWDHINVFPTFEIYVEQFKQFANLISNKGSLIYCKMDSEVNSIGENARKDIVKLPYGIPSYTIENGVTYLVVPSDNSKLDTKVALQVFGEHNLMNLEGARLACKQVGVEDEKFYEAIASFKGASKRLELVAQTKDSILYKDFAHSPSKLKATTSAVKEQFKERELIACMELHTFSSLNETFLQQYKGSMVAADQAIVYFNPKTIAHKKLSPISVEQVENAFGGTNIKVFVDSNQLVAYLKSIHWKNKNLLMMSSGNFDGIDFKQLGQDLLN
jgi:UDP-N-acetylmuramate: L-alanyl-gamma-D-glutamyl-meso-diaminopimelate ligase